MAARDTREDGRARSFVAVVATGGLKVEPMFVGQFRFSFLLTGFLTSLAETAAIAADSMIHRRGEGAARQKPATITFQNMCMCACASRGNQSLLTSPSLKRRGGPTSAGQDTCITQPNWR